MSRILILVAPHQQPNLPIAHLNTEHEVIVLDRALDLNSEFPIPQIAFDLCILDEASFDRIGPLVEALKAAAEPIFLPFLLVSKSQTPALSEQPFSLQAKQLERRIDDLIVSPAEPAQLHLRVEICWPAGGCR
jgi:hypothetical protein